jgi:peptidoglycan/LPS O-acetylase OafA/YrhL
MFNFLFALLATYVCYKRGLGYMLESRILASKKAEKRSYAMFLLAGVFLGDFIGLTAAIHYLPHMPLLQALAGTLCSILCGEAFYHYNKRAVQKIPTVQERNNY